MTINRTCPKCGDRFTTTLIDCHYCSDDCRNGHPERCSCRYSTLSFGFQSDSERGDCRQCPHPLNWHGPSGCHAEIREIQ